MFDPFKDFESVGYLRNKRGNKDPRIIKQMEHALFRANIDDAFLFLGSQREITYRTFLGVHRILFEGYYPWAGQDRQKVTPDIHVNKGDILFCHPAESKRAIDHGLRLAQNKREMMTKPGEILGLFAFGHPFLDGNGRTILLVHDELCRRAGFTMAWSKIDRYDYLSALTLEIQSPGKGILDSYLASFIHQMQP